jgi:hypothetical protein
MFNRSWLEELLILVSCCSGHFTYNTYRHGLHAQSMCMSTFHLQSIGNIVGDPQYVGYQWAIHSMLAACNFCLFPFQLVRPLKFMTLNDGCTVQYHIYSPIMTCKEQPSTKIGQVVISLYRIGLLYTKTRERSLSAVHTRSVLLRIIFWV